MQARSPYHECYAIDSIPAIYVLKVFISLEKTNPSDEGVAQK